MQSFDGGETWTKPRVVNQVIDPCYALQFDGSTLRCVQDGIAGARNDLAGSPNLSIANGAPSGAGATDEIVLTWAGFDDQGHEHVYVRFSTDFGASWSALVTVERTGDRGYYVAPALSPDGVDLYLVYNAFTTPFREDTATSAPRVFARLSRRGGGHAGRSVDVPNRTTGDPTGVSGDVREYRHLRVVRR